MPLNLRSITLRGVTLTVNTVVNPYFFLDTFDGTGTIASHVGNSQGTWSDPNAFTCSSFENPSYLNFGQMPIPSQPWTAGGVQNPLYLYGLYSSGSRLIACCTSPIPTFTGIYISDDNGNTWSQPLQTSDNLNLGNIGNVLIYNNFVLLGQVSLPSNDGVIYRSTDNGTSWEVFTVVPSGLSGLNAKVCLSRNETTGRILAAFSGVSNNDDFAYFSDDDGATWTKTSLGIPTTDFGITYLNLIEAGTEYTDGTYNNVPLQTPDGGTGATADIVIQGSVIYTAVIISPGQNYNTDDVITISNSDIGGTGSGISLRVGLPLRDGAASICGYSSYDSGYFWIFDSKNFVFYTSSTGNDNSWNAYRFDLNINSGFYYSNYDTFLSPDGLNINNIIPIDDGTWIISVSAYWVNQSYQFPPFAGPKCGYWRMTKTTAASGVGLNNAGRISGVQVTNIGYDASMSGAFTEFGSGGVVFIDSGMLVGSGKGYLISDLRTVTYPDAIDNDSSRFVPYEWGPTIDNIGSAFLTSNDDGSVVYTSFGLGSNDPNNPTTGFPFYSTAGGFGILTGTVDGSLPAETPFIDQFQLGSGELSLNPSSLNLTYWYPTLVSNILPPSGDFYAEIDFTSSSGAAGITVTLVVGELFNTGYTVSLSQGTSGVTPYNEFVSNLFAVDTVGNTNSTTVIDQNDVPPVSTGVAIGGEHTLRVEVTGNTTITAYLDSVQIQVADMPFGGATQYRTLTAPNNYLGGEYSNVPVIGGSGSGAIAWAKVNAVPNNGISGYDILSNGSGYSEAVYSSIELVYVTSGTGFGATADVTVDSSGTVTSFSVNNAGLQYEIGDQLTLGPSIGAGSGFLIQITSVIVEGYLQQVVFTTPGSGYQDFDIVTLPGEYIGGTVGNNATVTLGPPFNTLQFGPINFNCYSLGDYSNTKVLRIQGGPL